MVPSPRMLALQMLSYNFPPGSFTDVTCFLMCERLRKNIGTHYLPQRRKYFAWHNVDC